jgi:hypothetical protein
MNERAIEFLKAHGVEVDQGCFGGAWCLLGAGNQEGRVAACHHGREAQGGFAVKERLTQEGIGAIRSRLDHATPGTWGPGKVPGTIVAAVTEKGAEESGVTQEVIDKYGGLPVAGDVGEADRQFICQVRDDVGRLLEDREYLLGRIAELEGQRWPRSRG